MGYFGNIPPDLGSGINGLDIFQFVFDSNGAPIMGSFDAAYQVGTSGNSLSVNSGFGGLDSPGAFIPTPGPVVAVAVPEPMTTLTLSSLLIASIVGLKRKHEG